MNQPDYKQKPIGFRIIELGKIFKERANQSAQKSGVSMTNFHIIKFLMRENALGHNVSQKDICEYVRLKAPTISIALQNMEVQGFITRKKSEEDSRVTYVELTKDGIEEAFRNRIFFEENERILEQSISQEEMEQFSKILDKMTKALKEGVDLPWEN